MIELSNEARRLTSTFLNYRNEIDIYTEDNYQDKEFYKVLFTRLLNGVIKINDVTPLGSKKNVIERCKNEPNNGRKKIFIIGGDISIIHGKNITKIQNLYTLDAYCIENFLITESTVVNFMYTSCGTKPKEQIETELSFQKWLEGYTEFIELFIHFALADLFKRRYTLFSSGRYVKRKSSWIVF